VNISGVSGPGVMKAEDLGRNNEAQGHQVELGKADLQGASAGELFDRLEEKVLALADEMARLKQHNSRLEKDLEDAQGRIQELEQQLAEAKAERRQVRERLEKLVARLEAL